MRIVVFHNFYRSSRPSGENNAVLADVAALERSGHDVLLARKDSDIALGSGIVGAVRAASSAVYSLRSRAEASTLIESFRPDAAHLHNLNPLWSPSVTDALSRHGIPRVQVLHNYRLSCLNGSHMLDGEPCFRCLGARVPGAGVAHRCYNGSAAGSAVMAASHAVNEGRLLGADWYLAVSGTVRERAVQQGVSADRVSVKPEYLALDREPPLGPGRHLLFVGRLDRNKGCLLLLDAYAAYRAAGGMLPLRIAGSGPLEEEVRKRASMLPDVAVLGQIQAQAAREEIAGARAVVSPALWSEPFGLTVLEAWREGRPAIVTDLGGPAEMVSEPTGWVAKPETGSVASALLEADAPEQAHRRGLEGRKALRTRFSEQSTLQAYRRAWDGVGLPK